MPRTLTAWWRSYASTISAAASQMPVASATPAQGMVSAACWMGPERRLNAIIREAATRTESPPARSNFRSEARIPRRPAATVAPGTSWAIIKRSLTVYRAAERLPTMNDTTSTELPFVSVVIPVFNEERQIAACLNSVLAEDYPADLYEVIVAEGGSTDRTRAIVEAIVQRHAKVHLIDNPGQLQAAGLNRAIIASQGSVVARQDGHAEWGNQHLRRSVELLL